MSISNRFAQSIETRKRSLAGQLVDRYFESRPTLAHKFGEAGKAKCLEDANYHLDYLIAALQSGKPAVFLDYAVWAQQLLVNVGLPVDELQHYLAQLRRILLEAFVDPYQRETVEMFLEPAIAAVAHKPAVIGSFLANGSESDQLANRYLDSLLSGERTDAVAAVTAAVEEGMPIKDVYLGVFQPVQYEIGRLWHIGELSVAQEHFCTAVTQWVMSRLYPMVFTGERGTKRLVAACVSGDLHEIGMRMVTDLMELDGWDTCYLGANVPIRGIIEMVAKERSHILALSATMGFHLGPLTQTIEQLRKIPSLDHVRILVGGRPFLVEPTLVEAVGADAMANDAGAATSIANDLLK